MSFVLPDHRFGMTRTNYNLPRLPDSLPDKDSLIAANNLNQIRYRDLTTRQRVFLDSYLGNDFNGRAAALAAGYPEADCGKVATALLRKPKIQAALQWALQYYTERNKVKLERIIDELKIIAFTSMGDFWVNDGDGEPRLIMPEDGDVRMAAVAQIETETYFEGRGESKREVKKLKFKLHDKLGAIEKLLKILTPRLEADEAARGGDGAMSVNVSTINIVAVPQGNFVPAPPNNLIIEHLDFDQVTQPTSPSTE